MKDIDMADVENALLEGTTQKFGKGSIQSLNYFCNISILFFFRKEKKT